MCTPRPLSRHQPHSINLATWQRDICQRRKRESFSKTQPLRGSPECKAASWYFTDACRQGQEGPWDREPGLTGSVPVLTLPRARARPQVSLPLTKTAEQPPRTDTRHCFLEAVPTLHSPLGEALHISKCFLNQKVKLFILQLGK